MFRFYDSCLFVEKTTAMGDCSLWGIFFLGSSDILSDGALFYSFYHAAG